MTKNQVNTPTSSELQTPDFLKEFGGLGNENVTAKDVIIPRIGLIQGLSPQLKKTDAAYIQGAEIGDIFNQLTGELYKEGLYCVNCFFVNEWAVFRRRNAGGGFRGTFATQVEAQRFIAAHPEKDALEAIEQAVHYLLVLDQDKNHVGEAALVLTSTKMKCSRKWNGLIQLHVETEPRFGRIYKLTSVMEKNDKGEFANFAVSPAGFVTPELAMTAKAFYDAITAGTAKVEQNDASVEQGGDPADY